MESIFLATAIIGFVEFIKALNESQWENAEIIFGAALLGALSGYFNIDHLTIITGIQAGLTAVGTYKVGSLIGGFK